MEGTNSGTDSASPAPSTQSSTVTTTTSAKSNNMKMVGAVVALILLLAVIAGGVFLATRDKDEKNDNDTSKSSNKNNNDSDEEDNNSVDTEEDENDSEDTEIDSDVRKDLEKASKAMQNQKGFKVEYEMDGVKSVLTYELKTNNMEVLSDQGNIYIVDGNYYIESNGAWYKSELGEESSDVDFDKFADTESFIKSYPGIKQVKDEDCLASKNKCRVYEYDEPSADSGSAILRIDSKTNLIDSQESTIDGETSALVFEYGDYEVNLPKEAEDAISYEDYLNESSGSEFNFEDMMEEE